jgi:prevent-host-death family protein
MLAHLSSKLTPQFTYGFILATRGQKGIKMATWQAASARHKFSDIIDAAVAGHPQFVQRRDGKEVVIVSREYFDSTKANIKTYLLNEGYSGPGEDEFDAILADIRATSPDFLRQREPEAETMPED